MSLTAEGSILGTLLYMSPEQIEGQEADARTDIFAFGVVLYELITGTRPFAGESQASLIASILKDRPQPLNEVLPLVPGRLADVVQTCLEKDREKRWQSRRVQGRVVPHVAGVPARRHTFPLFPLRSAGGAGHLCRFARCRTPGPVAEADSGE